MITKKLAEALEGIGFIYNDDPDAAKCHCYAIYGGYMTSVYEIGNKKVVYFSFRFNESEENAVKRYDMSETFSSEIEEYSVTEYELGEEGMRVVSSGNAAKFLQLIDRCIDIFISHEIRGADYCSVCGNKFGARNPKKVTYGNDEHLMCEHCAINALEEYNSRQEEKKNVDGKPVKGILGSLLFSVIGAGIFIALYLWLSPALAKAGIDDIHYILCVTGALIAFLSYVGYRLFCKKISAAAYIAVPVNALLFTAVGQYLGRVFEFAVREGFSLGNALSKKAFWLIHLRNTIPSDTAENFINNSQLFYKLLAISLLFAAVACAIALLTLRDKSAVHKEPLKIETIRVNK